MISFATSVKKDGWVTTISAKVFGSISAAARNIRKCRSGLASTKSSKLIRLYMARMSRQRTLSQWCAAISVSSSKTRCAAAADRSSPASAKDFSM